jgi:hypothetical protein
LRHEHTIVSRSGNALNASRSRSLIFARKIPRLFSHTDQTGLFAVRDPRSLIEAIESAPALPDGKEECFTGYAVMGLTFRSGHVLGLRKWAASSIGPAYTAVWHRSPDDEWATYSDVTSRLGCPRYIGAQLRVARKTRIIVTWPEPLRLHVSIPEVTFEWDVEVAPTPATRLMNAVARILPRAAWRNHSFLSALSLVVGPVLGVGRVGLVGKMPNGQYFIANPRRIWMVRRSRATLAGEDLGTPAPLGQQSRLGGFWIPQRGVLAVGDTCFEAFDAARHSDQLERRDALTPEEIRGW